MTTNQFRNARPYDALIADSRVKSAVFERRANPTGLEHKVKTQLVGRVEKRLYPWDAMKLGDFFVVVIGDSSEKAMRIAFHQVAARRDFEIVIHKFPPHVTKPPRLRVTVTITEVSRYKNAAFEQGLLAQPASDGRWSETRKARRKSSNEKIISKERTVDR